MALLHFGPDDARLLGVRYEPGAARRGTCVVMCGPFGHEHTESLRAMRLLSGHMARKGFDVLRFDYRGTGDSAGEGDEATVDDWCEDTERAIAEAKRLSGATRVALVGVRLGAAIAAMVAAGRRDVDAMVLWGPALDGRTHARALRRAHMNWLAIELRERPIAAQLVSEGEVLGYPFGPPMRDSMIALDARSLAGVDVRHLLMIEHGRVPELPAWAPSASDVAAVDEHAPWTVDTGLAPAAVPARTIQRIAGWMGEVAS